MGKNWNFGIMVNKKTIYTSLIGLGFLILITSVGQATPIPLEHPSLSNQFRHIEQPLALKVVITIGGLSLICLELWWFLFSQPKSKQAQSIQGIQEVNITVDGGYQPVKIVLKFGKVWQAIAHVCGLKHKN